MRPLFSLALPIAVIALYWHVGLTAKAQLSTQIIAISGQAAPGGNGLLYVFDPPALNDAGQVAFLAFLTGTLRGAQDNEGIFRGADPQLTQISRKGQTGEPVGFNPSVAINGSSQVLFVPGLPGGFSGGRISLGTGA